MLEDIAEESGGRDEVETPSILKTISSGSRKQHMHDSNEMVNLQKMVDEEGRSGEKNIQKVLLHP